MDLEEKRKVIKYWRNRVFSTVGVIGGLCLLPFVAVEIFQTYKQDTVPQQILDVQPKLELLFESLETSNKSIVDRRRIVKEIEKITQENELGVTRISSWTVSHLLMLEKALSSPNEISKNELETLLRSFDVSFWRSFKYSLYQNYLSQASLRTLSFSLSQKDLVKDYKQDFVRDYEKDLEWNLVQYFERNLEQDLERDFVQFFERKLKQDLRRNFVQFFDARIFEWKLKQYLESDYERDYVQFFEQDMEQVFERNLVRDYEQIIQIKLYLLKLEKGQSPKIEIEIEQLSQQIIEDLTKVYELELLQNYGLQADRQSLTREQRQTKLIQFSFLAAISAMGLMFFSLLLIRQRNQGITWNMTAWCFMPEECVGELDQIYEGLKAGDKTIWTIRLIMLGHILILLKSLYIQVAIEDLFSPGKNKRD